MFLNDFFCYLIWFEFHTLNLQNYTFLNYSLCDNMLLNSLSVFLLFIFRFSLTLPFKFFINGFFSLSHHIQLEFDLMGTNICAESFS